MKDQHGQEPNPTQIYGAVFPSPPQTPKGYGCSWFLWSAPLPPVACGGGGGLLLFCFTPLCPVACGGG